jgi:hypothetical protein
MMRALLGSRNKNWENAIASLGVVRIGFSPVRFWTCQSKNGPPVKPTAQKEAWLIRMEDFGGPARPFPTIGQCLNSCYGWLEVECVSCKTARAWRSTFLPQGPRCAPRVVFRTGIVYAECERAKTTRAKRKRLQRGGTLGPSVQEYAPGRPGALPLTARFAGSS